jgi:hypothetical protein
LGDNSEKTVLNAFHKKRADPTVKKRCSTLEGKHYLQTFVQMTYEIPLCPEYTRTSITNNLLQHGIWNGVCTTGELTSSNSTFTSMFIITFNKISSQCIYVQGGGVVHTRHNILPNQPSELARFQLVGAFQTFQNIILLGAILGGVREAIRNCLNQQCAQCVPRRNSGHLDVNLLLNVTCYIYKDGRFRGVVNPFIFDLR